MKKIIINPKLSESDYVMYCMIWDESENIFIDTSELESIEDIVHCANLALSMPQADFSLAILEQISEKKDAPMDILERIISTGDIGCCESVCMRADLNYKLRKICCSLELIHKNPKNKE